MKVFFIQGEKGTISVFAIFCMSVLLTFSTAIFLFSHVEQQTQQRFLQGWTVKRAAQDGVYVAQKILNEQMSTGTEIVQGKGKIFDLGTFMLKDNDIKVSIQAKEKSGEILVLSIAREKSLSRRSVAYFRKIGSGKYEISHWEN